MGRYFEFTCRACGYKAVVSGGDDMGLLCVTTTIVCYDCKELLDVPVSFEPWDEENDLSNAPIVCPGRPPSSELKNDDEDEYGDEDEEEDEEDYSNPTHKVERWSHPGKCPRCGDTLEAGDCVLLWD